MFVFVKWERRARGWGGKENFIASRVGVRSAKKVFRVVGIHRLCRLSNDDRAWVRERGIGAAAHRVGVKGTRCLRVRRRRWPVARPGDPGR